MRLGVLIILFSCISCEDKFSELKTTNFDKTIVFGAQSLFGALDEIVGEDADSFEKCSGMVIDKTCVSFQKSIKYQDCRLGEDTLTGTIELEFNQDDCPFEAVSQTVRRKIDLTRILKSGEKISISHLPTKTFTGEELAGGERVQKMENSWWYENLGKNIKLTTKENKEILSLTVKTAEPVVIDNGLERGARKLTKGSWIVFNNNEKFRLLMIPKELGFQAECCHPVSGELDIELAGLDEKSLIEKASLKFNGCGKAGLLKGGVERAIVLNQCLR